MEIHISQQTTKGLKSIIINGEIDVRGVEEDEIPAFILDCEMKLNESGKVRVWFFGDPLK